MSHPSLMLKTTVVTASDPLIAHTETLSATGTVAANERGRFLGAYVSAGPSSGTAAGGGINVTLEILFGSTVVLSASRRFYSTTSNVIELFPSGETFVESGVLGDDVIARVTITGSVGTDTLDNLFIVLYFVSVPVI